MVVWMAYFQIYTLLQNKGWRWLSRSPSLSPCSFEDQKSNPDIFDHFEGNPLEIHIQFKFLYKHFDFATLQMKIVIKKQTSDITF